MRYVAAMSPVIEHQSKLQMCAVVLFASLTARLDIFEQRRKRDNDDFEKNISTRTYQ